MSYPYFKDTPLKALISTIEPIDGGVPTMTRWICSILAELNIEPILAWYAPWRNYPELSVPVYRFFSRQPKSVVGVAMGEYESNGIGSWFPELEFTHYLPSRKWTDLLKICHLHIAVSGNPLCATPYVMNKTPFLAWIATPWEADRNNRIQNFSSARKALDYVVNKPVLRRLEKRILRDENGIFLSLSKYSLVEFNKLSGCQMQNVMIMPVNTNIFFQDISKTVPWRIGFSGRYCDPRKNITLLLKATKLLRDLEISLELLLVGDRNHDQLLPLIKELGIEDSVRCYSHRNPSELAEILQSLDVFVIPSHQEGLCIAALEAMACGVPVVSTRCGGPEDYVIPEETGNLVESTPDALAMAILEMCKNREKRQRLSKSSIAWVQAYASEAASKVIFYKNLNLLLNKSLGRGNIDRFYESSA